MSEMEHKKGTPWSEESLHVEALKYQNRADFQRKSENAYHAARTRGVDFLNKICQHMQPPPTSWTAKMVREAALHFSGRKEFEKGNPRAYSAARRLRILDEVCASMSVKNIHRSDKEIFDAAKKFKCKSEFIAGDRKAYRVACKRGLIGAMFPSESCTERWDEAKILAAAKGYNTRQDFAKGDRKAYAAAQKRGILDQVCDGMVITRKNWTIAELQSVADKYLSKTAFSEGDRAAYCYAHNHGVLDAICTGMLPINRKWDLESLIAVAKKFKTRRAFGEADRGAYSACVRHPEKELIFAHMEYAKGGFNPEKPATVYYLRLDSPGHPPVYKLGITNKSNVKKRLSTTYLKKGVTAVLLNEKVFSVGAEAYQYEQSMHKKYAAYRYVGDKIAKNGHTEMYSKDILGYDVMEDIAA
jgi:hypothetical protein